MKDQKKAEQIAVQRIQMLSPLLSDRMDTAKKRVINSYICDKYGVSERTIRRYLVEYRQHGFDGLKPKVRNRIYKEGIATELLEEAILLRREVPSRSVAQIIQILEREGKVQPGELKRSTLQGKLEDRGYCTRQMRMYAVEWMQNLLQGTFDKDKISKQCGTENDVLLTYLKRGTTKERIKALILLSHKNSLPKTSICAFLKTSGRTYDRYLKTYNQLGINALFSKRKRASYKKDNEEIRKKVFTILHCPPSDYGFNRTIWRMNDLKKAINDNGYTISKNTISVIIKDSGFRWRKAKVVLSSTDPEYKQKLERIQSILSNLNEDELFFSIDEYGPFAIKQIGGKILVSPDEENIVPQWQKSKGSLIITAALELSTNIITHFYSTKKNSDEMIKMMNILVEKYKTCKKLYLSWDVASWHVSKKLYKHIEENNLRANDHGGCLVDTAPLPSSAQFLNVIESIFSGMARAIIHNSDYESTSEAIVAIDRYFEDRNTYFKENPKRAGNKIWGKERVAPEFSESNNCKDPRYR